MLVAVVKTDKKLRELSPYGRFREFAKRLVAVPKADLDEQLAKHQRDRLNAKELRAPKGARKL
jgi:hypothetical protein